MKLKKIILVILSFLFLSNFNVNGEIKSSDNITVIPIEGPIEQALLYVVRRGFDQCC